MEKLILEWQNALPFFGISYSGLKDGKINDDFIEAIMALENKYNAYGQIFTGSKIKISVDEAKKKFITTPLDKLNDEKNNQSKSNDIWESFLSQNLPIVGKVYDGDIVSAAKKLENIIGKFINKSVDGVIWNDATKQFNTSIDDIKKALELIKTHNEGKIKPAKFTLDQRVIKMSQFLLEKNK